jgi:hypothetical protein
MAVGKYFILVDWNADGDYSDAYDDITGDALEVSWSRGRDYASQLTGNSISGRLAVTLINNDGKYSPSDTGSPLTGNLVPGRSVQIQAGEGLFPYTFPVSFEDVPRWTGRIDSITPSPSAEELKTCVIEVFGVLGYLNQFPLELATQTSRRTDVAVGDVLDGVGWPADDRTLDTGLTTIPRFWFSGTGVIDALRQLQEAEAGFIMEAKDGKVVFQNRYHRLTESTSTTSQATFSDASGATNTYMALEQLDPISTVINHVEGEFRSYTVASVAVLWTQPETGSDSPTLAPGEVKTFEAVYPNPNSANDASEVNAWTTPAATTDVLANTASDGSGTNKTSDLTIAAVKSSERMAITLTNGSIDAVYLTKIQARGTAVTQDDPVIVRSIDTASKTKFGERKYVAGTPFFPSTADAQAFCDYQVALYESPIDILTMTFTAATNDNIEPALNLDISNRITIVATNDAQLGLSGDFFIEAVSHRLAAGTTDHIVQWQLSPVANGYDKFWVLGKSVLGTNTVPAY